MSIQKYAIFIHDSWISIKITANFRASFCASIFHNWWFSTSSAQYLKCSFNSNFLDYDNLNFLFHCRNASPLMITAPLLTSLRKMNCSQYLPWTKSLTGSRNQGRVRLPALGVNVLSNRSPHFYFWRLKFRVKIFGLFNVLGFYFIFNSLPLLD